MPLSEHEQRLLEQIEQGLYAEDPKFASTVRRVHAGNRQRRRIVIAVLGAIVGLGVVLIALAAKLTPLGVVGFLMIMGSCAYALAGSGRTGGQPRGSLGIVDADGSTRSKRQVGMKERMEDRLRRRFDEE